MLPREARLAALSLVALSSADPPKIAIYWKGANVYGNASAGADLRARGFTHAVAASENASAWFCDQDLAPILVVDKGLREASLFENRSALQAANASLIATLAAATAAAPCLAGVVDDVETNPWPYTAYDDAGEIDTYRRPRRMLPSWTTRLRGIATSRPRRRRDPPPRNIHVACRGAAATYLRGNPPRNNVSASQVPHERV